MPNTIVIYSTADWDNPFWTNKQHMALLLSQRGFKVLYVESLGLRRPQTKGADLFRIWHRFKKSFLGLKKINSNLFILSPLAIPGGGRSSIAKKYNQRFLTFQIQSALKKIDGLNHLAWTYNPTILELIQLQNPNLIIYHSVDDLSASPGMDKTYIQLKESELLKKSDFIFCTSQKIYQQAQSRTNQPCYYFPNVVDLKHFQRNETPLPVDLSLIPHPRIGFVGAISEYKFDGDLILQTAKAKPQWSFVIIGKIGEGQPDSNFDFLKAPNIYLLGPKSYNELPDYMHHFDVGLIPTPKNDYTNSMFPMKFFEYLACHLPVVAKDIDSLKDFNNIHFSYDSEKDFITAIDKALTVSLNYETIDQELMKNTWEVRLDKMLNIIQHKTKGLTP